MLIRKSLLRIIFPQKIFTMSYNKDVKKIFEKALESIKPETLIENYVKIENKNLIVKGKNYPLKKPCYIVGFGKAVLGMAIKLESILSSNLKEGIVIVPSGITSRHPNLPPKIQFIEGARNNLPDLDALKGANLIKQLCDRLNEDDLLITLISGGGSALLPLPSKGIKLEEKLWLIKELGNNGADILELNCVRKSISQLKGGGLAESAHPSRVISLILSDIIGDPLDFIASGPTIKNFDEVDAPLKIINKYNLGSNLPDSIKKVLNERRKNENDYNHVDNYVIGNNKLACSTAKKEAENLGYNSLILSTKIQGSVDKIAKMYAELARSLSRGDQLSLENFVTKYQSMELDVKALNIKENICIVGGGEPTVVVKGKGKGGRNQELALLFSQEINKFDFECDVTFLSCGTDGIDGPTDAAGAIGTADLFKRAFKENLKPEMFLSDNDTNTFYRKFKNGEFLIETGHTGTNVMDIHLLILTKKKI